MSERCETDRWLAREMLRIVMEVRHYAEAYHYGIAIDRELSKVPGKLIERLKQAPPPRGDEEAG